MCCSPHATQGSCCESNLLCHYYCRPGPVDAFLRHAICDASISEGVDGACCSGSGSEDNDGDLREACMAWLATGPNASYA